MATLEDVTRNSNIQAIWDVVRRFTRGRWKETTIPTMPEIIAMLSLTELTTVKVPAGSASPFLLATLDKEVKHAVLIYPQDQAASIALQNPLVKAFVSYDDATGEVWLNFNQLPQDVTLVINDMLAADDADTVVTLLTLPLQIQWYNETALYAPGDIVLIKRGQETTFAIANKETTGTFDEDAWTVMLSEEDFIEKYGDLEYRKSDKYFRNVNLNADITLPLPATAASIGSIGINPIHPDVVDYAITIDSHTISWTQATKTLAVDGHAVYIDGVNQPMFTTNGVKWDGVAVLTFGPEAKLPMKVTGTIPTGVMTVIGVEQIETVKSNYLALVAEITRAKAEEQRIEGLLDEERRRATGAEADLRLNITQVNDALEAKNQEQDEALSAEITRAQAAEKVTADKLAAEITARQAKDLVKLSWDVDNNRIVVTRTDTTTTGLALPLVDNTRNGLMTSEAYQELQDAIEDIATLKGQGTRRLTQEEISPEPAPRPNAAWQEAITNAWLAVSGGIAPVDNDTIISSNENTLWRSATYVTSTNQWVYRGVDTVRRATTTEMGIVLSTAAEDNTMEKGGSVFVEANGAMSVNGWDDATGRITDLEAFMRRDEGFATAAQGTLADSAVRTVVAGVADENGKIRLVINTGGQEENLDVEVKGLGSAAFTSADAYATAKQGQNADKALTDATEALSQARAAQEAATTAQDAAQSAQSSAVAAQTAAESAQTAAETAQQQATAAKASADEALTKANSALLGAEPGTAEDNGKVRLVVTLGSGTAKNIDMEVKGLGSAAYLDSSKFATADQGALAKAAVRSVSPTAADTNGTVKLLVDTGGTVKNVVATVAGLKSAAYTESTDYATAAQGTLATNAVRSVTITKSATVAGRITLTVNKGGTETTTNIDLDATGNYLPLDGSKPMTGPITVKAGDSFKGGPFVFTDDSWSAGSQDNEFVLKAKDETEVFRITRYGQAHFRGFGASSAFVFYTKDGYKWADFNTSDYKGLLSLYDAKNGAQTEVIRLDAANKRIKVGNWTATQLSDGSLEWAYA